jgi:hypothetical protein
VNALRFGACAVFLLKTIKAIPEEILKPGERFRLNPRNSHFSNPEKN